MSHLTQVQPLLRGTLAAGFSDAQCGFKAMVAAGKVRYYVEDEGRRGGGWFGGGIHDPAQLEELAQQDPPLAELLAQAGPNEIPLPGPDGAGSDGFGGGSGSEIAEWVAETITPTTVGGRTVYDLASPPG